MHMAFRLLRDRVGVISANGYPEVGEKIADAMDQVGKEAAREGLEGAAHLQMFPGNHLRPKLLPRLARLLGGQLRGAPTSLAMASRCLLHSACAERSSRHAER